MGRDAILNFWVEEPRPVVLTARAAADIFASHEDHVQAEFLVGVAKAVGEWDDSHSWAMECRFIAEKMTDDECFAVRMLLITLMDHLEAIPQERKAADVTDSIVAAVNEAVSTK